MRHSRVVDPWLHDPKGKTGSVNGGTGTGVPLDLNDNTANAFHIRNNGAGTPFAIDTTNGAERLRSEYDRFVIGDSDQNLFVRGECLYGNVPSGSDNTLIAASFSAWNTSGSNTAVSELTEIGGENNPGIGQETILGPDGLVYDGDACTVIGAVASAGYGLDESNFASYAVVLGGDSVVTDTGAASIIVGHYTRSESESAIVFGNFALTYDDHPNSCVIGAQLSGRIAEDPEDWGWITRLCIGRGWDHTAPPSEITVQVTDGTPSTSPLYVDEDNPNGSALLLRSGLGAGSGASGDVLFRTGGGTQSAGVAHTITDRMQCYGGSTGRVSVDASAFLAFSVQSAPVAIAGFGLVYAKTIGGVAKLFVQDGAGTETQLTP